MSLSPVFEVMLTPKDPNSSITQIMVRVDDPVNINDSDKLMGFMETQFPMYNMEHIIAGYKKVTEGNDSEPT